MLPTEELWICSLPEETKLESGWNVDGSHQPEHPTSSVSESYGTASLSEYVSGTEGCGVELD
jgi:hypothetical protein